MEQHLKVVLLTDIYLSLKFSFNVSHEYTVIEKNYIFPATWNIKIDELNKTSKKVELYLRGI